MIIPNYIAEVLNVIKNAGFEVYLVGGCVRDYIMKKKPHDYDMASSAEPWEIKKLFKNTYSVGEKHGTIGVVTDEGIIEITTFRHDGVYLDSRHPKSVSFTKDLTEDLARRDFTMNAIAFDGEFKDPFGGVGDIEAKIIKTVGEADRRFSEDALRIMRAMRFSSQLGFTIEENTEKSMFKNCEKLKLISEERIFDEFQKMLLGKNAEEVLIKYSKIVSVFIPEIIPCIGFEQKNVHHIYDVYTHLVKCVSASPKDEVLRFAAFFHDIGKPMCFSIDEKGGHFYSHAAKSAQLAEDILTRFKADKKTRDNVVLLVKEHDRTINENKKNVKRVLSKFSPTFFDMLLDLQCADSTACGTEKDETMAHIQELRKIKEKIINESECFSLKSLAINGNDILSLGVSGKKVGELLNAAFEKVLDGDVQNEREELLLFIRGRI